MNEPLDNLQRIASFPKWVISIVTIRNTRESRGYLAINGWVNEDGIFTSVLKNRRAHYLKGHKTTSRCSS